MQIPILDLLSIYAKKISISSLNTRPIRQAYMIITWKVNIFITGWTKLIIIVVVIFIKHKYDEYL